MTVAGQTLLMNPSMQAVAIHPHPGYIDDCWLCAAVKAIEDEAEARGRAAAEADANESVNVIATMRAMDVARLEAELARVVAVVRSMQGYTPGMTLDTEDGSTCFGLEPSPFGDGADWLQRGPLLAAMEGPR